MPIGVSGAILGIVVFLNVSVMGQVKTSQGKTQVPPTPSLGGAAAERQPGDVPQCNGASSASSHGPASSHGNLHRHSVTLSWNAAVPGSSSPRDAIKGYNVYRSLTPQAYSESNRISKSPLQGTQCVDATVQPRKTYFYIVKAVTESGKQSGSSVEIKAEIPFP
jgi:hypothetical protein